MMVERRFVVRIWVEIGAGRFSAFAVYLQPPGLGSSGSVPKLGLPSTRRIYFLTPLLSNAWNIVSTLLIHPTPH